ncbi:MAG: hypothetical protein BroJett033_1000 [Chloroflexota bacterium]|nr:MAG: hypothetical protein BroJett033_1000 [Chloroflexota bacterium]
MRALLRSRPVVLLALIPLLLAAVPAQQAQPPTNDRAAQEIIAQVNAWRLEQGLWPLRPNPTLQALALDQARYLLTLNALPSGSSLHLGAGGTTPPQRAVAAPYNWPAYGRSDHAAIGENAAVGSVRSALSFWRGSDIHRRTALNPAYREVGAAALPYGSNTLFIITFGARPDVLPAFYNLQDNKLYLTSERYQYAPGGPRIQNVTQVRLFGADGQPLTTDWISWQASMSLPGSVGDRIYVLYSDGQRQALAEADVKNSDLLLPALLPGAPPALASATPPPPAASATASATAAAPAASATPSRPAATAAVSATPPALTPLPASPTAAPSAQLVYDRLSLTLLNVAGRPLDISALTFAGSEVRFAASTWAQVANVPLAAFPNGHCVQIVQGGSAPAAPAECRFVRSVVQLTAGRTFWTMGDFSVLLNGTPVASCPAAASGSARCSLILPPG